jgi:hypothetical protein
MTSASSHPLGVGLVLPHWTNLPAEVHRWFATDVPGDVPGWSDLISLARSVVIRRRWGER